MVQDVFVDANKIIQFGHGLDSAEAKSLAGLVDAGLVRVVTTDLTISEVAKRFAKTETEKLQEICKIDFRSRAKRYLGLDLPEVDREALHHKIFREHFSRVDRFHRSDLRAKVLNIDSVAPSEVPTSPRFQ